MEGDAPGLFPRSHLGQESRGASGLTWAWPVPQTPKVCHRAGQAVRGPWFVALPCSRWDQPRAQGPSAVPTELTAWEFPWVPLTWPATPPCPACLAFQTTLGFPAFSHSTRPLASIGPAGSCEAWRDTGRSLQCLHLDLWLSLPPFPMPLPNSSVSSWRPFPATVPYHHPQGFELPGAQGSA